MLSLLLKKCIFDDGDNDYRLLNAKCQIKCIFRTKTWSCSTRACSIANSPQGNPVVLPGHTILTLRRHAYSVLLNGEASNTSCGDFGKILLKPNI